MDTNFKGRNERRKYVRARFQEDVTVHGVVESKSGNVFEVQEHPLTVRAENVSEGGIRIEIGDAVSPSKIFKLNFSLPKAKPVDVYSKLAWYEKGTCGLQFIVVDEEIRRMIRSYVEKNQ